MCWYWDWLWANMVPRPNSKASASVAPAPAETLSLHSAWGTMVWCQRLVCDSPRYGNLQLLVGSYLESRISAKSYQNFGTGYLGLIAMSFHQEKGHFGGHGGIGGARCNATGCTYRPSCACPWSIPSFNIRVTGPSTSLGSIFIPHPDGHQLDKVEAKIVIAPQLDDASHFDLYAVAIGSDDSFHAGDAVSFNPPGDQCGVDRGKKPKAILNYV